MSENKITLYPSNWLYNAGVIGVLRILERRENGKILEMLESEGIINSLIIDKIQDLVNEKNDDLPKVLEQLSSWHWHFIEASFNKLYGNIHELARKSIINSENSTRRNQIKNQLQVKDIHYENEICEFKDINDGIISLFSKAFGRDATIDFEQAYYSLVSLLKLKEKQYVYKRTIGALFAKGGLYQNKFNPKYFSDIKRFTDSFDMNKIMKQGNHVDRCSFCASPIFEISSIASVEMNDLFPSYSQFPNAFWNNNENQSTQICSLCDFFIMHHHLSLIKLSDYSEIFINAPSFKVMYELNKLVKESFGSSNKSEARTKREILASTVIEYTNKIQTSLGIWTGMNIEIVTKKKDVIEFYSLPYNVIKLITDRQIASILSDLGEYSIYNIVLDEKYSRLIDITQKVLKLSTKEQLSKNEENLMKEFLNNWKNQKHLTATANKLLKLYSLIEDKLKRN